MTNGDLIRLLDLLGHPDAYRTGQNGLATYTSKTTLTLTQMPFTPEDVEFRAVVEYGPVVPGRDPTFVYWSDAYSMSLSAGVLTVQGATFQSASTFVVVYTGFLTTPIAAVGHNVLGPEESKALTVIQNDPAKLNTTDINLSKAIEQHGTDIAYEEVIKIAAEAVAGTPVALTPGQVARLVTNLTRSLYVRLTEGLQYTTSSTAAWLKRPSGVAHTRRVCTVADTGYPIVASSTPIYAAFLSAREANTGVCRFGGSASAPSAANGGAVILEPSKGIPVVVPQDDLYNINVASTVGGDIVDVSYVTGAAA